MLVIRAGICNMLVRIQTGKTLIRLLQSDLGLHCSFEAFWQATGVRILEHLPYLKKIQKMRTSKPLIC